MTRSRTYDDSHPDGERREDLDPTGTAPDAATTGQGEPVPVPGRPVRTTPHYSAPGPSRTAPEADRLAAIGGMSEAELLAILAGFKRGRPIPLAEHRYRGAVLVRLKAVLGPRRFAARLGDGLGLKRTRVEEEIRLHRLWLPLEDLIRSGAIRGATELEQLTLANAMQVARMCRHILPRPVKEPVAAGGEPVEDGLRVVRGGQATRARRTRPGTADSPARSIPDARGLDHPELIPFTATVLLDSLPGVPLLGGLTRDVCIRRLMRKVIHPA
jgi:hypothetical protein